MIENVGEKFDSDLIEKARLKTWELVFAIAEKVRPGHTEKEVEGIANVLFKEFGSERKWHPSKIRFGINTLKGFRDISEPDIVLKENDLFFIDIGPVFFGHEGDCGKTFALGNDPDHQAVIKASEDIFDEVKSCWKETSKSGSELYQFAEACAQRRGYILSRSGASGHRISDFPHALHHKGSLLSYSQKPQQQRWILEIQIKHPTLKFGAFFEDMLS